MAEDPRTEAKFAPLVLLCHLLKSLPGKDVTLMDQSVQELCTGFDDGHVGYLEAVLWRFDVQNHL